MEGGNVSCYAYPAVCVLFKRGILRAAAFRVAPHAALKKFSSCATAAGVRSGK
jgi:hypothetical protein